MKLRIISGLLRGRFITVPNTKDFRPTLERTRESVAEIIKSRIPEARVADICAGSGAMGFEMLSRGALHVDFVERDRTRAELIKKNADELGVAESCRIISRDVRSFLKNSSESYDIIYFDPPYDSDEFKCLNALLEKLNENGILLYEYRKTQKSNYNSEIVPKELLWDSRTFGDTAVDFYHRTTGSQM